jgi:hypothetical protein
MREIIDNMEVDAVVTRFGEQCTRVELRTYADPIPTWFHPDTNKGHNAIHRDGLSLYFAIKLDLTAREAAHPFTNEVAPNTFCIEQLGLFGGLR